MRYVYLDDEGTVIGYGHRHSASYHSIELTSPRPPEMVPVIDGGEHVGWRHDDDALKRLAASKRQEIDAARDQAFAAGLPYDIAGEPDVVQTRPQDQINLLGLSAKAQRLIAAGDSETTFTFRGLSNVNHELTAEQMDALALAALAHIEQIYGRSWARKDAIDAILADESLDNDAKREAVESIAW